MEKPLILAILVLSLVSLRFWPAYGLDFVPGWDAYYHSTQSRNLLEKGYWGSDELFFGKRSLYPPAYHFLLAYTSLFSKTSLPESALLLGAVSTLLFASTYYLFFRRFFPEKAVLYGLVFLFTSYSFSLYAGVNPQPTMVSLPLFLSAFLLAEKKLHKPAVLIGLGLSLMHLSALYYAAFFLLYGFLVKKKRFYPVSAALLLPALFFAAQNPDPGQNMPVFLKQNAFTGFLPDIGDRIGLFLVFGALLGVWRLKKHHWLLFSLFMLPVVLVFARALEYDRGVLYMALPLSVAAGVGLEGLGETVLGKVSKTALFAWLAAFSFLYYPLFPEFVLTPGKIEALEWLKAETSQDSVVLALEGNWVEFFSRRRVVFDSFYLGVSDVDQRFGLLEAFYSQEPGLSEKLGEYNVSYALFFKDSAKWLGEGPVRVFPVVFENPEAVVFKTS